MSDADVQEMVRLCKLEAQKLPDGGFSTVLPGTLESAGVQRVVRFKELSQIQGVNAIKPGASLTFGPGNLTVIYGQNGSGKSGFARLIKQLCGSRSKDDIRPNVFVDGEQPCSAQCQISIDGNDRDITWNPSSEPHPLLRFAQVFDSKTALQYMGRTESSYEPSSMRFISELIRVSDAVAATLAREKETLTSQLPTVPPDLIGTAEIGWLRALKPTATDKEIEDNCLYSEQMDEERIRTEGLLAEKDVAGRLAANHKASIALASNRQPMAALQKGLSDGAAGAIYKAKAEALAARKSANDVAQKAFATSPLNGVGELPWKQMWERAREYSEQFAYPTLAFPVISAGSNCVLCQQPLAEDAQSRLADFETYVTGGFELTAKTAELAIESLLRELPALPSVDDWIARIAQLGFDEARALDWYQTLQSRRNAITQCVPITEVPAFDWSPIEQAMADRTSALASEKSGLEDLQKDGQRTQLQAKAKSLNALKWLALNKGKIIEERDRLAKIVLLEAAVKLAATQSLTMKRTELGRTELDEGYQSRFDAELKALGGRRLSVALQSRAQGKGVITFGLALTGAQPGHSPDAVLSEGEARIVALAAFLADSTGSNQLAPFVFDDPISSLDQDFEERVINRLVELTQSRQVVVFTHRLSLVALIDAAVKRHGENPKNADRKIEHTVQSLRRLGGVAGIQVQQNLRDSRPEKALNAMRDHAIPKLKKLQTDGDADNYDFAAKGACSDFRISLERTIEFVLFNDVISRFRRDINTRGKLHGVAKVDPSDCDYLDALMTKYSVYEHSQAEELPQTPVDLAEFEQDVMDLIQWMDTFKKRASN
ncbi:AAA family ATPase [Stenotrophomonas maltophilia]|uniref:AAA family ATPase n=1 Tax=Stenotrophomonas maltophilia TaxID=40324 RepID=UPI0018C8B1AA|nr:AAA family ATPase [Stenotrophomonas maltophilia]